MVKNPPADAGDAGSIPQAEDTLEKDMATHSSIFCLGNPMGRETWWATVHGVAKS